MKLKQFLNNQSRNELIKINKPFLKEMTFLKKDSEIKGFSFRQTYGKHDKKSQLSNTEN